VWNAEYVNMIGVIKRCVGGSDHKKGQFSLGGSDHKKRQLSLGGSDHKKEQFRRFKIIRQDILVSLNGSSAFTYF
jgi:hypothetical protein